MKKKATEAEIRDLLRSLNPDLLGPNKQPIVAVKSKFILTGKIIKSGNEQKEQFTLRSVLSPETRAALPNLKPSNYYRIVKTDYTKPIMSPDDVIEVGRKPWADNLFESQQPELFATILNFLQEKDTWFEKYPADPEGNPRLKLKNPVLGAFLAVQVPAHNVIGPDGKIMKTRVKDIRTGKFGAESNLVMREMRIFLYPHQFASLEAIAIAMYQKRVEPLLAEEVIYKVDSAGNSEREVVNNAAVEDIPGAPDNSNTPADIVDDPEAGKDDSGNALP